MLITLGFASMFFAFFSAIFGIVALLFGIAFHSPNWLRCGRQSCLIIFPLLSLSIIALITLIITNNYQVDFVYQTISNSQPFFLKIAALWGKQSGSLLFWSWVFSIFLFLWAQKNKPEKEPFFPFAALFLLFNLAFSIALHLWIDNPFQRYWHSNTSGEILLSIFPLRNCIPYVPQDGLGMNPLLRHYGMILHPPALYLGFICTIFPAAIEFSSLIKSPSDSTWIKKSRSWVIFGWIFLAAGLILGSRWAYDVLGWGGYWGWDSVEVAALIPFLLSTAYLHAAIGFSRTGGFRIWASILIFVVYVSVVFAMFVTRSGLVSSVHSFSISALSKYLTAYLITGILLTVFILILRKNQIRTNPEKARLSGIQSVLTRESFFTIEIILLIGISFLCLWGILLPNMSKIFSNTEITVGADYYIHATGPLFGLLILFMGFVPLTSWGKSISRKRWTLLILFGIVAAAGVFVYSISHQIQNIRLLCILWLLGISILIIFYEFISFIISAFHKEKNDLSRSSLRNSRFLLSHLIHMGIIFMAFGIIGIEFLQKEQQIILTSGEKTDFAQYTLTLQQIRQFDTEEGETLEAEIQVESGNHVLGLIKPQRKYYTSYNQDTTVPGILSSLSGDLYIIMNADSIDSEEERKFTIFLNPWINWLWIGGIIVCIGGVFLWLGSMKQKK